MVDVKTKADKPSNGSMQYLTRPLAYGSYGSMTKIE